MDNKAEEELAKRIGLEQKEIEWGLKGKARVMNGFKGWIDAKLSEPEEGKFIFIYHPEKGEIPLEIKVDCALKEKQNDALIFKWMAQLPSKHNENPTEEVFKIKGRFREKPKRLINFAMEVSDRVPFEFTQLKEALIMIDNEIAKYTLFEVIGEDPVEEMSEVEKDRALRLLKDERILPKILEVTDWRVVGEQDTRLMIYLVCATCKLEKRVNGQITGESSAGKTWVKQTVLDLFPPEAVQSFSRITGTALDHAVDIDWNNKILDVAEAEGIEQAIEIIKHYTDDSGSGSRLLIPEKDEKTGAFTSKIKISTGIPVFLTTTAKPIKDYEFMNRLINVPVDLSEEQTNAINQYQVKLASQPWLFEKDIEIYEDYQNAFRLLEGHAILIPYAAALIDMVNPRHIKSRRDLNKVLWLIEASALVHQYQRPVLELDDKKYVIATFQDLMNAFLICERGFKRTFEGLHESTVKVKKTIEEMGSQLCLHETKGVDVMTFSVADLLVKSKLGWTRQTLYAHLAQLVDIGYLGKVKQGREAFFWQIEQDNVLGRSRRTLSPLKLLMEGVACLDAYQKQSSGKIMHKEKACGNVTAQELVDILNPKDIYNPFYTFITDNNGGNSDIAKTLPHAFITLNDISNDCSEWVDFDSDYEKQFIEYSERYARTLEKIREEKKAELTRTTKKKNEEKAGQSTLEIEDLGEIT